MRLDPPAWTLGRQVMGTYNLGEYVIPPGSIILMSQYVMHRNPLYFPIQKDLTLIGGQRA